MLQLIHSLLRYSNTISPSSESSYSTSLSNVVFDSVKSTTSTLLELELLDFTPFVITLIAGYIKLTVAY
ncbi:unnamed protein product [Rhizophagus irregularis]|nr:unnamed protein product [Rhizophagus irregularis]